MFMALHKADMLRVSASVERTGLDAYEHGGNAYEQDRKVIRAQSAEKAKKEAAEMEASARCESFRRASFKTENDGSPPALPLKDLDVELELGLPAEGETA
jgi:hypothetical protein